ncbi:PREDICTED: uncharacterized protein LOC109218385 [Nicotiana attenuata]|uniref:uncharacterized protein LOC109218385 n=1 Tax=Nicotiana attenuata TaxID=49451 RepID=UPI000905304F|nr:PREDICTED: uncharacterized protein LOC109218385 [Nicotiana attenuata]
MAVIDQDNLTGVETTATVTATSTGIDPSDPLYLHPFDNPGAMFVSVAFDGIGYRSWRNSVLSGLSTKNKLGFISGECKQPDPSSQQFRQWERCDNMVTSWILNSLSKETAVSVEYANDGVELWKELEVAMNKLIDLGCIKFRRKLTVFPKEELTNLNKRTQCSCACNCGAKESMCKAEKDRRLIQFLMGLNEVYTVVRGSILMMNPLPSLAQAFSLLVQDEKQREIRPVSHLSVESTSLNVSASGQGSFKTNFPTNNNYSGIPRAQLICEHCKKPGRSKNRCYKIHGYPQNNQNSAQNFTPRHLSNGQNYGQKSRYNKDKKVVASCKEFPMKLLSLRKMKTKHKMMEGM